VRYWILISPAWTSISKMHRAPASVARKNDFRVFLSVQVSLQYQSAGQSNLPVRIQCEKKANAPAERCLRGQAARLDGRSQALIVRDQGVDVKVGVPMGRESKLGKGRGGE
jgi:hypothetical protein